ncbi:hypothetical protein ACFVTY_12400 [Streptomyces sp. NPDC058067]|uniref:hypothetical protein n=1 Tax=Streptomyces sp. NPDC058067 TaxID=3346324 RepID=UPI0036ED78F4
MTEQVYVLLSNSSRLEARGSLMDTACVLLVIFLAGLLRAYSKIRGIRALMVCGCVTEAVCEYVSWDEGKATSRCYFLTGDGRRIEVSSSPAPSPILDAGDMVDVVYDPRRPRFAVLMPDRDIAISQYRVVMFIFGVASFISLIGGILTLL